jgi:hypothetical protein
MCAADIRVGGVLRAAHLQAAGPPWSRAVRRPEIIPGVSPVRKGRIRFPAFCAAALPLCAAAIVASGCGETVIDHVKAQETIEASLEKSLHEKITSVQCPSGVKVETGATFTCTVDFSNGSHEIATLKIRNEEADVSLVGLETNK